MRYNHGVLAV